jgi:hypothetical protein
MAKATEIDILTGEVTKRDLTADELALQAESKAESTAKEAEQESKAAKKLAVYEKLGLTPDEVAALLA